MSADNGVYILKTIRTRKQTPNGWGEKTEPYSVYRVTIACAIENFDYYEKKQPYNIGAYMMSIWGDSPLFEDKDEALKYAHQLEKSVPYCEYGVSFIDTEYVFYGDM